jgi:hypothetical protein
MAPKEDGKKLAGRRGKGDVVSVNKKLWTQLSEEEVAELVANPVICLYGLIDNSSCACN